MKTLIGFGFAVCIFLVGCDDLAAPGHGSCKDSVAFLSPVPAGSAATNHHECDATARLEVSDKGQGVLALCKCPETNQKPTVDAGVDGGEKK